MATSGSTPHEDAEQAQLVEEIRSAIGERLTARQREVLVAVALNGVPIEVLAERLGSTRGALYRTLHDARRRLPTHLRDSGVAPDWLETR